MKCDLCNKPAVVHELLVHSGVRREVHLCEEHATAQGFQLPGGEPIEKMLQQFVLSPTPPKPKAKTDARVACGTCGRTLSEFRHNGVLGCADCYRGLGRPLEAIIQRAQNGGTHHVGKSPGRLGASIDRQLVIGRLVKDLEDAVSAEQFERAAQIRDRLHGLETGPGGSLADEPDRTDAAGHPDPAGSADHVDPTDHVDPAPTPPTRERDD
ncbi:MAG: UvrB/UvrC motif-containing protein [Phycisphaerales bacterium]